MSSLVNDIFFYSWFYFRVFPIFASYNMIPDKTPETAQVAFALGSLSFMPSVQNFAYNATIALLMNFILQTSVFLILIRVDLLRQLSGR